MINRIIRWLIDYPTNLYDGIYHAVYWRHKVKWHEYIRYFVLTGRILGVK